MLCSDDTGRAWDCAACLGDGVKVTGRELDETARRRMGCGWIAGSTGEDLPERLHPYYHAAGAKSREVGVCPGYLMRLPGVVEAAEAAEAAEAGLLAAFSPEPSNVQVLGALAVKRAQAQFQTAKLKKREAERECNRG